jgi:hypothetical protein
VAAEVTDSVWVGDVTAWVEASEPLAAFVRESNRGGRIWFVEDLAAFDARLSAAAPEA